MKWFSKRKFNQKGGSENLKNRCKSCGCFCKFLNITKNFIKKIIGELKRIRSNRSTLIPPAGASCRGSILIEFAVCMPILIILLFYIHDLMKIKRLYSQTEFVGQQMANILQNIAKTKEITMNDIKYAASLAYLTIYPGTTMFTTTQGNEYHVFAHQPRVYIYYVKSKADQKASTIWGFWMRSGAAVEPKNWDYDITENTAPGSVVSVKRSNVVPSSIYPTLKIDSGAKVILETQIRWNSSEQRNASGKLVNSAREVFGCYLVNPKNTAKAAYFSSVVIFAPHAGFTENEPT